MGSDMCLSCVPDTFLEDCLAGAPTVAATTQTMQVERRRLDALRRLYLRFVGDVPSFLRLCERVEASQNIVCDREVSVSDATDVMRMDESMLASLHAAATESQEVGIFFAVETTVREIPGNVFVGFRTPYMSSTLSACWDLATVGSGSNAIELQRGIPFWCFCR